MTFMPWTHDPEPHEIAAACESIRHQWTNEERRLRRGGIDMQSDHWTVPQFLVHHKQTGSWVGGTTHEVQVWRCVDGK